MEQQMNAKSVVAPTGLPPEERGGQLNGAMSIIFGTPIG